jgi:hypothetical protein
MGRERHSQLVVMRGATLTTTALGQGRISRVARILSVAVVVVVTTAAEQEPAPSTAGLAIASATTPRAEVLAVVTSAPRDHRA